MVVKYGYAVIEAETETEALELTHDMEDSDFDWSDFDDAQVVDDDVDFEQPLKHSASNDSQLDIFLCKENGKLYVPCEHELFQFEEEEHKLPTAKKIKH